MRKGARAKTPIISARYTFGGLHSIQELRNRGHPISRNPLRFDLRASESESYVQCRLESQKEVLTEVPSLWKVRIGEANSVTAREMDIAVVPPFSEERQRRIGGSNPWDSWS